MADERWLIAGLGNPGTEYAGNRHNAGYMVADLLAGRLGIGRPPGRMDPADFVLRDFAAAERKQLPGLIDRSGDAVEALLTSGLAAAQNEFHADFFPAQP